MYMQLAFREMKQTHTSPNSRLHMLCLSHG
jgi:hypothetical protein